MSQINITVETDNEEFTFSATSGRHEAQMDPDDAVRTLLRRVYRAADAAFTGDAE